MNKKTALVTGASRGIGKSIATLFAENGYNVLINYNNSEKEALDLYNELKSRGLSVDTYKADVSKKEEVNLMINYCIGQFERIDILINNAGISRTNLFKDISYEEWDEVINTNLNSVFYTTKKALQYMIPQMSGKIINISSIWGMVGGSYEVHYSTSKAAIIGMTKALAKELGPSNIQVNCIAPGVIKTDMLDNLEEETVDMLIEETPLMRLGTPEDIANCALFLGSEKSNFITGQIISPNGGFVIV
ncbi:3-oxoacyl-ACP reductase [[Clostridium] sordellii]|uniref:elongation factor P 5-aminopentanone reductase n=1 Tax=Paraclostridium sordellii TaxID=1505 RepID=UPI0005DE88D8|nr:SDR family oxidoreductase [Paeniclostridium sordellii]MCR1848319.1 SDR family oxidoreductase [Paeniclostridium sordellii]CEN75499.1 3-oxoacyl-ACP reductase [[Clostridium] sordellii] [Paeniclostridium sordellii]